MSSSHAAETVSAPRRIRPLLLRLATLLFLLIASQAPGAAPSLDAFFPAGASRGTTNQITATGKFDPWPPKVWTSGAGLRLVPGTNTGKFTVSVADDAPLGAQLVRLHNAEGSSEPRFFVVGTNAEILEVETNNHFRAAQVVTNLPVTVNGKLASRGDVDSFQVTVPKGEWLEARVDSYGLMSKLDAVLRLVSTNGEQLAWNHDFISLDPRLIWQAPADTVAIIQVFGFSYPADASIQLTGNENAIYRLHLALGKTAPLLFESSNEQEPNNRPGEAQPIALPATQVGRISDGTDEDRYRFTAQPGDVIEARLEAAGLGSPLDGWLRIEDAMGNQLARNDDADNSRDARLEWKIPSATNFLVAVGSITHRGGEEFGYRLQVRRVTPDLIATAAASSLTLNPGATNTLGLTLKTLRGLTNSLLPVIQGLPAGVTCLTTNLPARDGATALQFVAGKERSFKGRSASRCGRREEHWTATSYFRWWVAAKTTACPAAF